MRLLVLAVIIILTFSNVKSQSLTYNEAIVEYLEINGTEAQYAQAVDALFTMLNKRYTNLNIPQETWKELENTYKEKSLKSIKLLLVTPYRKTFSEDNIKRMLTFYKSDVGQQMLADPTSLNTEQKAKAGDFYASDAGAKLLENRDSLGKRVSEVSEIWSRDLYRVVTNDLGNRGFALTGGE